MIQKIRIFNYLCIYDMTIDLTCADLRKPLHYEDYEMLLYVQQGKRKTRNNRIVPVLSLYGANASGKTTVLKAVMQLQSIVAGGLISGSFQPNRIKLYPQENRYTEFEIEFWKHGDKYDYLLKYDNERIVKERLRKNETDIFVVENNTICQLSDVDTELPYIEKEYRTRCINITNSCQIKSFLSEITRAYPGTSLSMSLALDYMLNDIMVLADNRIEVWTGINKLASVYRSDLTEEERVDRAVKEIVEYLGKLDSGIVALDYHKEYYSSEPMGKISSSNVNADLDRLEIIEKDRFIANSVTSIHKSETGNDVRFKLSSESKGTKLLMGLLGVLLYSIKSGKTILVDELDESMHSLLLIQLVRLFKEKRLNNCSQIIFTAHNTDLIAADLLSLYEIGIVRYDKKQGSCFSRLADNPEAKSSRNIRKLYLDGYFGGIPFPFV